MATRIAYAFILLVNSIVSWIMLTPWAWRKLHHLTLNYMDFECDSDSCYGWFAVHRINFALALFHFILGFLLIGVQNTRDSRAAVQNGYWGPKVAIWVIFVVLTFFIPEGFFLVWGNYFALFGAMLFLLLGLILLVDLAHTWAELCLRKIDDHDSRTWRGLLIGSTLGMYLASFAMTIVMYLFFANTNCAMNQAAITVRFSPDRESIMLMHSQVNLLLFLIVSFVSIQPVVQESNPKAGLAQAAMVTVYCTYLTMSAVSMEPDDYHCNPLIRSQGTRTVSIVVGAIVTMLTVAYTTTRAATQGLALGSRVGHGQYAPIGSEDYEHGLVTQQPAAKKQMRQDALRAAVEAGSIPASALDESDDESDDARETRDDERNSTQYNYSLFHFIFLLATTWVATLLTQGFNRDEVGDFTPVGRTYWASWVKIISAWICYAIYIWSLIAPVLMPDRFVD